MRCPFCRDGDSRVLDSRDADDGAVTRRRRACQACGRRFTTVEAVSLQVLKRNGTSEPFSREKVVGGVRKACQGRPVDASALARLAQQVEDAVRAGGASEVAAHDVGTAILVPLRELDEVAYLRFASVYRGFDSLADFEREIAHLRSAPGPGPRPSADGDLGSTGLHHARLEQPDEQQPRTQRDDQHPSQNQDCVRRPRRSGQRRETTGAHA